MVPHRAAGPSTACQDRRLRRGQPVGRPVHPV